MSKNSYIDYLNTLKIGMNLKAFSTVQEGVVYESLEVSLKENKILHQRRNNAKRKALKRK